MKQFDPFDSTSQPSEGFPQTEPLQATTNSVESPHAETPQADSAPSPVAESNGPTGWQSLGTPLPKPPKKKLVVWIVCGVLVAVGAFAVFGLYAWRDINMHKTNVVSQVAEAPLEGKPTQEEVTSTPPSSEAESPSVTQTREALTTMQVAEKVMPSVVGVVVYEKDEQGDIFEAGEGSGIILSKDGYIATNAHVVLGDRQAVSAEGQSVGAEKIEIYFEGGDYVTATLVGADPRTDLALLKVKKEGLTPAVIGDSTALQIGEKAIAIGNPTGRMLSGSLTQGVISGLDRVVDMGANTYSMNYIQTDAAISPGNSGGALTNTYGEVVGINTSKIAAEAYEGIGFAIPMHEAMPILENLKENGYVAGRPRIGITFTPITVEMAEILGIPSGLRVVEVDPSVDAHKQGLLPGSIITHIDGEEVALLDDVSSVLADKEPGDSITLTVLQRNRNNQVKEQKLKIRLAEDITSKVISE